MFGQMPQGAAGSRNVIVNGVKLSDAEVNQLQMSSMMPILDGDYWWVLDSTVLRFQV